MSSASNVTMATLRRISAAALAQEMLAGQGAGNPKLAIVDVRDDGRVPPLPDHRG